MRLEGKVALVTGGTSGIGRRMVERFVDEGASVFLGGRRVALGAEVARATGATFIEADVALGADAAGTIATGARLNGRIDVLVNNAGGPSASGRLEVVQLDAFDATIAIHVPGALAHIKRPSRKRREQSFVNGEDIVVDGGLIWGRRFSEAAAGGQAMRALGDQGS
jgi:NAD(P)-dependent dehydrogenase (short-subunit alcohol dehydrogenase family)